jgi:hypothetical protein
MSQAVLSLRDRAPTDRRARRRSVSVDDPGQASGTDTVTRDSRSRRSGTAASGLWALPARRPAVVVAAALAVVLVAATVVVQRSRTLRCHPAEDERWEHYRDLPPTGHPNALWARHSWVGDGHTPCQYRTFARQIRQLGLTDVFLHAGPLGPDGTVGEDRYRHAGQVLDALHDLVPGVRLQAYLGQVEGSRPGTDDLDLDDPANIERTVATAERFLALGFDGIHYDIEPVLNGDLRFIDLYDRTRVLTGSRGAVLSIAVEERLVDPDSGFPPNVQHASVSDDWLRVLAEHVDQIAVMVYDSRMKTAADYERWTEYQTRTVADVVADKVDVLIGVPTDKQFVYYHTEAENAGTGSRGLRRGAAALGPERAGRVGGAVFAEWVSTEEDYGTFEREWVRPAG